MTVELPDLSGKVALVTGGNAGIGAEIVKGLASANASCVYICSRSKANADTLAASIRETNPKANLETLTLDLESFDSIKECAAEFNRQSERLDLLFLNAGVAARSPGLTKEGYEYQFGINHVGHALLTQLLMPKLLATVGQAERPDVRIIVTSSDGAWKGPKQGIVLDSVKDAAALGSPIQHYFHSKLANVFFARQLAHVYPSITSASFHPGVVYTGIWKKADGLWGLHNVASTVMRFLAKTPQQGAETGLWCAAAKVGEKGFVNGCYVEPVGMVKGRTKTTTDDKQAEELWEWTEKELASHGGPGWPSA